MKRPTYIALVLLLPFIFFSCKKEKKSIEENTFELSVYDNSYQDSLTLKNNKLKVNALLIPEGIENSINLYVSSQADPEGFVTEVDLSDYERKEGKVIYQAKELLVSILAADSTDAQMRRIKVNYPSDEINISLGEGLPSGSFPVDCRKILYYNLSNFPELAVYGYRFEGNEREAIQVGTDRVPNSRLIPLFANSGNGFEYYTRRFSFHDGDFSVYNGEEYFIGLSATDGIYEGTVYLHYYDYSFSPAYGEEGSRFLE